MLLIVCLEKKCFRFMSWREQRKSTEKRGVSEEEVKSRLRRRECRLTGGVVAAAAVAAAAQCRCKVGRERERERVLKRGSEFQSLE